MLRRPEPPEERVGPATLRVRATIDFSLLDQVDSTTAATNSTLYVANRHAFWQERKSTQGNLVKAFTVTLGKHRSNASYLWNTWPFSFMKTWIDHRILGVLKQT